MYRAQNYELMKPEMRPQDDDQELTGWTFESCEFGGEYPDSMPQAIKATDAKGRVCWYVPITVNGRVVDSKGFVFDSTEGSKVEFKG